EAALALRPDDGHTLLALARVAIARAEWTHAEGLVHRAAAALPGDAEPAALLGEMHAARAATGSAATHPPQATS
ncbi:MAG TPA: hypothetical protein VJQ45_11835, partial [Ktedonobacterales bacterium]|nr:hypothetical protein [Ktedonobacterales bacterium]